MSLVTQFPEVIESALGNFDDIFDCEPQRKHFREYITGLIIASNKTVSGINSEFAFTTDQSCLNRFVTEVGWDVDAMNDRRIELMQQDDETRFADDGVIAVDDTLIDHTGKLIEDVGYMWDHAEERSKIAHDYIIANYICKNGKHYPLDFRRFRKKDQCEARGEVFLDHNDLLRSLVDWVSEHEVPGDFTFDSYFTNAYTLNYIHTKAKPDRFGRPRGYVADLKANRKIEYRGKEIRVDEFAKNVGFERRQEIRRGDKRQWHFTCTVRLPRVSHKVRLVVIWNHRRDQKPRKILVSNRVNWEVNRILRCYRFRWTGTETFHRDGKQYLGMGDCQLRSGQGQTRHMYLVMLAYSLLLLELKQGRAKKWAGAKLTTIGEACRAVTKRVLTDTLSWAIDKVIEKKLTVPQVMFQLALT